MPFVSQEQERCAACNRIVYQTEKTVVEEKDEKKVYHKTCIRCCYDRCNKVLSLGQYSSIEGKFYCKPHFKQLFATKGNYEEGFGLEKEKKWDGSSVPATKPASFVPIEQTDVKKQYESKATSEETAAKFRKFREEGQAETCAVCARTVFLAEKLVAEEKNVKKIYHKNCFKCAQCDIKLDLRNYGSSAGKIYCPPHLKEVNATNRPGQGSVVPTSGSFIPATNEEKTVQKSETPSHIAEKFKGLGGQAERCKVCQKTVYATEKVIHQETSKIQSIYHKACLRCSSCKISLDVTTMGTANSQLFCKVHLPKPEIRKSEASYFVSPLHSTTEYTPMYDAGNPDQSADQPRDDQPRDDQPEEPGDEERREEERREEERREEERREEEERRDSERDRYSSPRAQSPVGSPQTQSPAHSPYGSPSSSRRQSANVPEEEARKTTQVEAIKNEELGRPRSNSDSDDERRRKREERERQREEEERKFQEEREKREKEREERRKRREEESSESGTTQSEDSGTSDLERRRREREERRRQQEEEAKKEQEEQARKSEERRKRLEALRNQN